VEVKLRGAKGDRWTGVGVKLYGAKGNRWTGVEVKLRCAICD